MLQAQILATHACQIPIAPQQALQTNVLAPELLKIQRYVTVERLLEMFAQVLLHTAKQMVLVWHAQQMGNVEQLAQARNATQPPTPASSVYFIVIVLLYQLSLAQPTHAMLPLLYACAALLAPAQVLLLDVRLAHVLNVLPTLIA